MISWRKKSEKILMNIYGSIEDLNQHLERKIFMAEHLKNFKSVKGFLDHSEGVLLYKLTKE